jgi:hypothetical protein
MPNFCLYCDSGIAMKHERKNVKITIHNHKLERNFSVVVPKILGWHCPVCEEVEITDEDDLKRYTYALNNLQLFSNLKTRLAQENRNEKE